MLMRLKYLLLLIIVIGVTACDQDDLLNGNFSSSNNVDSGILKEKED